MIKPIRVEFQFETKDINPHSMAVQVNGQTIGYVQIMTYMDTYEVAGYVFDNHIYKTEESVLDAVIECWKSLIVKNVPDIIDLKEEA